MELSPRGENTDRYHHRETSNKQRSYNQHLRAVHRESCRYRQLFCPDADHQATRELDVVLVRIEERGHQVVGLNANCGSFVQCVVHTASGGHGEFIRPFGSSRRKPGLACTAPNCKSAKGVRRLNLR